MADTKELMDIIAKTVKEEVCREIYDYWMNTAGHFPTLDTVGYLYDQGLQKAAEKIKEKLNT